LKEDIVGVFHVPLRQSAGIREEGEDEYAAVQAQRKVAKAALQPLQQRTSRMFARMRSLFASCASQIEVHGRLLSRPRQIDQYAGNFSCLAI